VRLTRQLEQVQFQDISNNGYIVLLQNFLREVFAGVNGGAEVMRLSQRNVHEPDTTASLVALEVRVMVVKESEYSGHDDGHTLSI
jgi:hypothetical protein